MKGELLRNALSKLAGAPASGGLAFCRALHREEIAQVLATQGNGSWRILGVSDSSGDGWIRSDEAVELREKKTEATILLVETEYQGAGLDGVFSSARKITESALFSDAERDVLKRLPRAADRVSKQAYKAARSLGGRGRHCTARERFHVLLQMLQSPDRPGGALVELGLWPVAGDLDSIERLVPASATMVERLWMPPWTAQTAEERVAALALKDPEQGKLLTDLLRRSSDSPVRESLAQVLEDERLWLGNLEPGFLHHTLQSITLVPMLKNGKPTRWSGLTEPKNGEGLPLFILDPGQPKVKLEVRWASNPETLPKGSVVFDVSVMSGEQELASLKHKSSGNPEQRAVFRVADLLEAAEEHAPCEARVVVSAPGESEVIKDESELFLLRFDKVEIPPTKGPAVRCPVEGLIREPDVAQIVQWAQKRKDGEVGQPDKNGNVSIRLSDGKRSFRVLRPRLLQQIEESWQQQNADRLLGRWRVACRPDGSTVGSPEFLPFQPDAWRSEDWFEILKDRCARLQKDLSKSAGMLSRVYLHDSDDLLGDYLNAWAKALESGPPELALAFTIEVTNLAGKTLGLIVPPLHPLRAAWQAGYDDLALHLCHKEGYRPESVLRMLEGLDGAHLPFLLPGLEPNDPFVFGDCLGLAGVAMVPSSDPEPKATVSLLSLCYRDVDDRLEPTLTVAGSKALATEVRHYLESHPESAWLRVLAIKPGDGAAVVRALGEAQRATGNPPDSDDDEPDANQDGKRAFRLDLISSDEREETTGRYLVRLNERRRVGSEAVSKEDLWCMESLDKKGRFVPRLRWSVQTGDLPDERAHLALAFDTFHSAPTLGPRPVDKRPLLGFGLIANLQREFDICDGIPQWRTWIPAEYEGEKLPSRAATERLTRLQSAILEAVAHSMGDRSRWPVLLTRLEGDGKAVHERLHQLCDWVITMDRSVGVEYFDSPRDLQTIYDAYVIDAVPERDDLGCLQLITSTTHLDEVRDLLDSVLKRMSLSGSERNCRFLLDHLKALSGHLAMRLAAIAQGGEDSTVGAELVALAMARSRSIRRKDLPPDWPNLDEGFLVPLDDVRDLLYGPFTKKGAAEGESSARRADLLYVRLDSYGRLRLQLVEVKYRRHLSTARSPELLEQIAKQLSESANSLRERYVATNPNGKAIVLRAARLGRVLRFYAEKAARHQLGDGHAARLLQAIERYLLNPEKLQLEAEGIGLVFCPEYAEERPDVIDGDRVRVFLFGPHSLPDLPVVQRNADSRVPVEETGPSTTDPSRTDRTMGDPDTHTGQGKGVTAMHESRPDAAEPTSEQQGGTPDPSRLEASKDSAAGRKVSPSEPSEVLLGRTESGREVFWSPDIKGNPHLMVLGQPGMGKTTALINICQQLAEGGVAPIVFSYHEDLDSKLAEALQDARVHDCYRLGFNPMRVLEKSPLAHVEVAGMLRDIFAAIFPDLGDVQLSKIREALLQSYRQSGWDKGIEGETPRFSLWLDCLRKATEGLRDNAMRNLVARLQELEDYQFFDGTDSEEPSLLEAGIPRLIRIHSVRAENVQRAYACFMLYRVYQEMFLRGPQDHLTHAVVFDEAHRASSLRLLPTMAKECRKFGLLLIVASQEAKDFDRGLFSAILNFLVLRLNDVDARQMAKQLSRTDEERRVADRMKEMPKFQALFRGEGIPLTKVHLRDPGI